MWVAPWGIVVPQPPAPPGVSLADTALDYGEETRGRVGPLPNRRTDRYRLERV